MFSKSSLDRPTVNIWTCSGHERFRPLLGQFLQDVCGVIICVDMFNPTALEDVIFWYNEIQRYRTSLSCCPDANVILVGTKGDLNDAKLIKMSDLIKLVTQFNTVQRLGR